MRAGAAFVVTDGDVGETEYVNVMFWFVIALIDSTSDGNLIEMGGCIVMARKSEHLTSMRIIVSGSKRCGLHLPRQNRAKILRPLPTQRYRND